MNVWFIPINWPTILFSKYVIELANNKSKQSYMANVNYDISYKAKYMWKNDWKICSSLIITKCMPMIGTTPNVSYKMNLLA